MDHGAHRHSRAPHRRQRCGHQRPGYGSREVGAEATGNRAGRGRGNHCRHRLTGHVLSRHRLPGAAQTGCAESVGVRRVGRVLGVRVRVAGGGAVHRQRSAQEGAGDRRGHHVVDHRLHRSRDLCDLRRRRGRSAARTRCGRRRCRADRLRALHRRLRRLRALHARRRQPESFDARDGRQENALRPPGRAGGVQIRRPKHGAGLRARAQPQQPEGQRHRLLYPAPGQ